MNPAATLRTRLADPTWRYALLCGIPAAGVVAAQELQPGSDVETNLVLVAAVVAGFLFPGEHDQVKALGVRVTLIGMLPALAWMAPTVVHAIQLPNPLWFTILSFVLFAAGALVFVFILAILGMAGAMLGYWLAGKSGRYRAVAASG